MHPVEQQFFHDLEKKLWTAADKLRSSLDASVYKHVVLGLIFLKYVSDAFEERQRELRGQFQNPAHDYYMAPEDYADDYEGNLGAELEVRDYYTEKNVFWVPVEARWQTLRDLAQLPPGEPLPWNAPGKDTPDKMRTVGWLIDNAMEAVERENPLTVHTSGCVCAPLAYSTPGKISHAPASIEVPNQQTTTPIHSTLGQVSSSSSSDTSALALASGVWRLMGCASPLCAQSLPATSPLDFC